MQTFISVTGMSCGHCVAAVTKALEKVGRGGGRCLSQKS